MSEVAPKRIEPEYSNLSEEEISDLMVSVKRVNKCIMVWLIIFLTAALPDGSEMALNRQTLE